MTDPMRVIRARRQDMIVDQATGQVIAPETVTRRHSLCWLNRAELVYAISADDLLALWIPTYATADYDTRQQLRIQHAILVRTRLVNEILVDAVAQGIPLSENERSTLLRPASEQRTLTDCTWRAKVPLVVIHGSGSRPSVEPPGQIIWLRPRAPYGYLRSLATAGVIALAEANAAPSEHQ